MKLPNTNHILSSTTAYGGLSDVPLDIDLLVAGASCVDLSNLNNNRAKKLSDGFESKNTFNGVKIYCKKASPPIVILENVRHTTVWKTFQADFEDIGYAALYIPADTKQYYLPQTRERQYMICIHKQKVCGGEESVATEILSHWATLMQLLQRPASSSFSNFLLPPDDLRALSLANKIDATGAPGSTSWEACRGIHQKVRDDLKLGYGMPIGYPYRESSDTWLQRRPGREIECLNLCYLRWACFGSDANYKESASHPDLL
jgi:site-specific DNA-cytosine methylase